MKHHTDTEMLNFIFDEDWQLKKYDYDAFEFCNEEIVCTGIHANGRDALDGVVRINSGLEKPV